MGLNNAPRNSRYKQGLFIPTNPEKYYGNVRNIFYRSNLEYKFCIYCDTNPYILKWGCESHEIPYTMRNLEDKVSSHRYYPDFYIEVKRDDLVEGIKKYLIEVKPETETKKPKIPKDTTSLKKMKSLEYQLVTYNKNVYKWIQAVEWCKKHGMEFKLVVEENFIKTLSRWVN